MESLESKRKEHRMLFLFSLIIIMIMGILVFIVLAAFQKSSQNQQLLYILNRDDLVSGKIGRLEIDRIISFKSIFLYQLDFIKRYAFTLVVFIIGSSLGLSALLGKVLNKLKQQDYKQIAEAIRDMDFSKVSESLDPMVVYYQPIKDSIEANLNDYQKLHNYISHEQKNHLALLRVQAERKNDFVLISQIDKLTAGLNDALTLSESSDQTDLYPVDIVMLTAEIVDQYRKSKHHINFEFSDTNDYEILAKKQWLNRAISNLIDNAIKYSNKKPVHISLIQDKGSIIIKVRDQGIGMKQEKLQAIFDYNYRINDLNQDGFGIGLSLVAHVADLCGGYVSAESDLGKGSTFYLSLPQL